MIKTQTRRIAKICLTAKDFVELKKDISQIRHDLEKLELRMTIKLGSLLAVAISVLATTHAVLH